MEAETKRFAAVLALGVPVALLLLGLCPARPLPLTPLLPFGTRKKGAIWVMFNVNHSDKVEVKPHNEQETYLQVGPLLLRANNTDLRGPRASTSTWTDSGRFEGAMR